MENRWKNVVCPGCACLCDDVELSIQGSQLVEFSPACSMGADWFRRHLSDSCASGTHAWIDGQVVALPDAIARAAEILHESKYPVVYGLSRSSTPGQKAAVEVAEVLRGVVDTTASLCHGPSIIALQEIGEVTCSLGEVRNRSDLVIFWGCNPAQSHPRHAERYSVTVRGKYLPQGRADRKIVMIGDASQIDSWSIDDAGTQPDLRIPVEKGRDFETLGILTRMLRNSNCKDATGPLQQLLEMIHASKFGSIFFGIGLAETGAWGNGVKTGTGHINVSALLHLVAELNAITRFVARRMRLQGDVSGADNVMLWQTAYPFAVDFSRGFPRYSPGEYTVNDLLERQEVDAALFVGEETVPFFTAKAREYLERIPTIVLDYAGASKHLNPNVRFKTAAYGLQAEGTSYRMDNVPLRLRQLVDSDLPTDEAILRALLGRLDGQPDRAI